MLAVGLALIALGLQLLIRSVTAPDSYQLFLGAVAVSVIYGGTASGFLTLACASLEKLFFFVLPEVPLASGGHIVLARMLLFVAIGFVICSLGGQLQASQRTLSTVLASTGEAILATDRDGRVRFANRVAEMMFSLEPSAAVGRPAGSVLRLVNSDTAEPIPDPAATVLHTGQGFPFPSHTAIVYPDGRGTPVAGGAYAARDAGKMVGVVIVCRDVSERDRLIAQLEDALARVKQLSGLLPICAGCKKIRDDAGAWHPLESFIRSHSEADFSHGICPECVHRLYPELEDKIGGD